MIKTALLIYLFISFIGTIEKYLNESHSLWERLNVMLFNNNNKLKQCLSNRVDSFIVMDVSDIYKERILNVLLAEVWTAINIKTNILYI